MPHSGCSTWCAQATSPHGSPFPFFPLSPHSPCNPRPLLHPHHKHAPTQVAAGGTHSLCLTATGRIFTWGRGSYGRLGLGKVKDCYSPVECILPGGHERWRIAAITCGGRHSMCLAVPLREGPLGIPGEEVEVEEAQEVAATAAPSEQPGSVAAANGAAAMQRPSSMASLSNAVAGGVGGSMHGSLHGTDDLVAAGIIINAPTPSAPEPFSISAGFSSASNRPSSSGGGGLTISSLGRTASNGSAAMALPMPPALLSPRRSMQSNRSGSPPTINVGGVHINTSVLGPLASSSPRHSLTRSPQGRAGSFDSAGIFSMPMPGGGGVAMPDVSGMRGSPRPSSPRASWRPHSPRLPSSGLAEYPAASGSGGLGEADGEDDANEVRARGGEGSANIS